MQRSWTWMALTLMTWALLHPLSALAGTVEVGLALPLTDDPDASALVRQAVESHAAALNESGRLGEHRLEVVTADTAGDAAGTLDAGGAQAVIGFLDDERATAAATSLQAAGVPLLVPNAQDPRLVRTGDKVFSMSYDAVEQAKRIAAFLRVVEKAERIGVIVGDDQASKDFVRALNANLGGMEIAATVELPGGTADTDRLVEAFPQLAGARKGKDKGGERTEDGERGGKGGKARRGKGKGGKAPGRPDRGDDEAEELSLDAVVVLADAENGATIVNAFRKAKLDVPILGTSSWTDAAFLDKLGSSKRVYLTSPWSWEIVSEEARALVDALGTQPPVEALFARDALELVAAAVENGQIDRAGIAADLGKRTSPDEAVAGISGLLYFDKNGSLAREPLFQAVVKGHLKPHFSQLTRVTDPRAARAAKKGGESKFIGDRDIVVVDGVPYYHTKVVYAGLDFYRVNSVDVQGQNFDVEFFMWFQWMGDVDVENIDFLNGIYGIEDKVEVLREDRSGPVNYICYKIKGTYLTPYDLRAFPFDTQRLPFRMAHKTRDSNEIVLVVDHEGIADNRIEEIYPEEWIHLGRTDHSASYEPDTTFGDPMYSGPASRSTYSVYESNIVVKRILFPYLVTLFMPLGIMIVISLFVFFVPRSQFDARMTITMTALLSILVFHLAQGETLPSVGYLMRADQFFMATYLLMFALIAKTILVNALNERVEEKYLNWTERIFTGLFVPICLAIYVVLIAWPTA